MTNLSKIKRKEIFKYLEELKISVMMKIYVLSQR